MTTSEAFCLFFDNVASKNFGYHQAHGLWRVHENSKQAKLTDLDVKCADADLVGFNENLTRSMPDLTYKRSTKFEDKDCDGVAFVCSATNEGLLFVELKSKYGTSQVSDAIKQMCFSFLKMHAMLSLCSEYALNKTEITFCVATKCAANESEDAKVVEFIGQTTLLEEQKAYGKFLQNLFSKGYDNVSFNNLFKYLYINLPLHDAIKNKKIKVHLVTSSTPNDTKAVFNY
jgi:hypothetical protein